MSGLFDDEDVSDHSWCEHCFKPIWLKENKWVDEFGGVGCLGNNEQDNIHEPVLGAQNVFESGDGDISS